MDRPVHVCKMYYIAVRDLIEKSYSIIHTHCTGKLLHYMRTLMYDEIPFANISSNKPFNIFFSLSRNVLRRTILFRTQILKLINRSVFRRKKNYKLSILLCLFDGFSKLKLSK